MQASYNLGNLLTFLDGWTFTGGYRYSWDFASNLTNLVRRAGQRCQGVSGRVPNCGSAQSREISIREHGRCRSTENSRRTVSSTRLRGAATIRAASIRMRPRPIYARSSPEHLTDIEIGVKSDWTIFGIQGRTNLDAYHDEYTDIQRMVGVVAGTIGSLTENAAAATLEGIEFEGTLVPVKRLELSGMYSYANGKYDQYLSPTQGDLSGLPFTGGLAQPNTVSTSRYHVPFLHRISATCEPIGDL